MCDNRAEYEIQFHPFGPDNYTYSCSEHLCEMLSDANAMRIYKIHHAGELVCCFITHEEI